MRKSFWLMIIIVAALSACDKPPRTPKEVKAACQREFGDEGPTAVNECVFKITTQAIIRDKQRRQERAEEGR